MSEHDHTPSGTRLRRRRLLGGSIAAGGLAAAGLGGLGIAAAQSGNATRDEHPSATPARTGHPAMLRTQADFDRMKAKVQARRAPWIQGWEKLVANGRSHSTWQPRPVEVVVRGGGQAENYAQLFLDIAAAYQNALRWKITGDTAHGDTARDICNAWSRTLKSIDPTHSDSRLASGIYGFQFANVGELLRDYDGFELGRFQDMLLDVFYPLNSDFLVRHNNTCDSHYWANWDLCNMASIMAIGILCDDRTQFDEAVDYFHHGAGNGAIDHAIPFVYDGGLAQWQESGRDQAHSVMGIGLMAAFMEMAWNQGVDLYSVNDNAFAKAAEYVARYNLGRDVPFTRYSWGLGANCDYREHTVISSSARGERRPVWEMVYGHYTQRRGFAMPNVAEMAGKESPEGGGGDYNPNSGGYDALGFGTLTHVRLHWNDIPDDLTPL
ncbi:alginate lyase family protein [Glycomyces sp. TRM65418]|uniref:alginate lyase family protein n=1 Tax=Glycomyces sp. TRM65418 TaxID=2867006 RepID=UPI001CE51F00|nr:alginate lyase family protein [Glycomyces sp. TRM65418]MCC3761470.1 alginate lyase family protein [Glycomyces sp. TRM65418]QZD55570.1 alginate lyase family protein [Glycomyces sp. TRM65418]